MLKSINRGNKQEHKGKEKQVTFDDGSKLWFPFVSGAGLVG